MLAGRAAGESPGRLLAPLAGSLACALAVFGLVRPTLWFSVLVFALIVMLAGARTLAGSAAGLAVASQRDLTVMSIRAAATQLGMVAGAGLGGAALAARGYGLLGPVLAILFAAGAVPHVRFAPAHPPTMAPARVA